MKDEIEENPISKPNLNIEETDNEIEPHEKSIQVFETEKDFKKYKSIFSSVDEFNNKNCKRFINENFEDLEAEIKTYITTEKLENLQIIDFNRKINGIKVRIITFRPKV